MRVCAPGLELRYCAQLAQWVHTLTLDTMGAQGRERGASKHLCCLAHRSPLHNPPPHTHTPTHSLTSCCRAAAATPRAGARTSLLRRRSPLPRRAHRTSRPRRCLTAQIRRSPRQISPAAVLLASPTSALHVSRHSVHLCAQEHTMG